MVPLWIYELHYQKSEDSYIDVDTIIVKMKK